MAVGKQAYKAYRDILQSDRFQRLENVGARAQRLLFASTGTKDKTASDTLYIAGLAAPNTVNTMPEDNAAGVSPITARPPAPLPPDGGDAEAVLAAHIKAGIDLTALSTQLQSDGAKGFVKSWNELLGAIESKSKVWPEHRRTPDDRSDRYPGLAGADVRTMRRSRICICGRCSPMILAGRSASRPRVRACSSTIRRTASPTRRFGCCCSWRKNAA